MTTSLFCVVDDKHVPLHRVMWLSDVPHFCGEEDCAHEGQYEIRLEQGESVWAKREDRDSMLSAMEAWHSDLGPEEHWEE